MLIAIAILLSVLCGACVLLTVLGLPGAWLMVALAGLTAWWKWDAAHSWTDQFIGGPALLALFFLAVVGEIWEFVASAAGAKRAGASSRGAFGALVGAIIGGILGTFFVPIPIIGSLVGACFGAAIGAWAGELSIGRGHDQAVRSGIGAGVGKLKGTLAKLAIAVAMWLVVTVAAFWL
ncbi:MAG: DUF456 domain-containing protein [Planctomycetes bacterium]|nr:DUF456 domain-containing protein [Planctomycetota bacterium]